MSPYSRCRTHLYEREESMFILDIIEKIYITKINLGTLFVSLFFYYYFYNIVSLFFSFILFSLFTLIVVFFVSSHYLQQKENQIKVFNLGMAFITEYLKNKVNTEETPPSSD
jgi:hypothetical protein